MSSVGTSTFIQLKNDSMGCLSRNGLWEQVLSCFSPLFEHFWFTRVSTFTVLFSLKKKMSL